MHYWCSAHTHSAAAHNLCSAVLECLYREKGTPSVRDTVKFKRTRSAENYILVQCIAFAFTLLS